MGVDQLLVAVILLDLKVALLHLPVETGHPDGGGAGDGGFCALAELVPDWGIARREHFGQAVLTDGELMAHGYLLVVVCE